MAAASESAEPGLRLSSLVVARARPTVDSEASPGARRRACGRGGRRPRRVPRRVTESWSADSESAAAAAVSPGRRRLGVHRPGTVTQTAGAVTPSQPAA